MEKELPRADPETAYEADMMILDELIFKAITALLEEYNTKFQAGQGGNAESLPANLSLKLVKTFIPLCYENHGPDLRLPESVRFRLVLQRFVEDFVRRYVDSPHCFHRTVNHYSQTYNRNGAFDRMQDIPPLTVFDETSWVSGTPIPESKRALYVSRLVDQYSRSSVTAKNINQLNRLQLLDLLPMFMHLCGEALAQPAVEFKSVTDELLDLAAEFMIQSVLEQYMVYGAAGTEKLGEAFSWHEEHLEACSRPLMVDDAAANRMSCPIDRDHKGSDLDSVPRHIIWTCAVRAMSPPNGVSLIDHLENLAAKYTITDFEDKVLGFLEMLQYSQAMPILSQVERGKVDGLTVAETDALKRRIGWPVMVERKTNGLSAEDGEVV